MKNKIKQLFKNFGKILPAIYPIVGSFVIVAGWNWYHLPHKTHLRFVLISCVMWLFLMAGFWVFKWLYKRLIDKIANLSFWKKDFYESINEIYFIISLFFLVFFSKLEVLSLFWFLTVIFILFWRVQTHLSKHPISFQWLTVNRAVFLLVISLFLIFSLLQYLSFYYYILDDSFDFFNIVLFRSWSITCFWLFGFAISSLVYFKLHSKLKFILFSLWSALLIFSLFVWALNIGTLYWTGYYFNPVIFSHVGGGVGQVFWNNISYFLFACFLLVSLLLFFLFKYLLRAHQSNFKRPFQFYNYILVVICLFSLFGISSFWNTPEFLITKSFIDHYKGIDNEDIVLPDIIKQKLERFGLFYNLDNFKVAEKDYVFKEEKDLLPDKFKNEPPNILIVFFESFSSCLTSVYNDDFRGLTPGLQEMADNPNTTVFKKYYNASTPTITGIMSQLCSFLPPTGHEEIEKEDKFRSHHLLCLPEVLKEQGGYTKATYVTAVPKTFAHKNTIFSAMGVDEIWGKDELAKITKEEPLSWGYSDHQLYPLMEKLTKDTPEPWLTILSTVDNHPPYDLAEDMVCWEDGKNLVLNSVYTSDDAFKIFWEKFEESGMYDNTIVVAVADHAIFPQALNNKNFDDKYHHLTFYDENMFMMYVPDSVLPKEVDVYSSGVDFTPTILNILNINTKNSFEGWSIFGERKEYPNLVGMHEIGLYINEEVFPGGQESKRDKIYGVPTNLNCQPKDYTQNSSEPLTLCELKVFFNWKREMLKEGRCWK